MSPLTHIFVLPTLPERIARLEELAYNLWWSWNPPAVELFQAVDPQLWKRTYHNPVKMLRRVSQERLDTLATDAAFLDLYDRVMQAFDAYMNAGETWFSRTYPQWKEARIAYFSAEFGLHESLPIYSGGLGILSGDHCKTASDLGIPLVGVGFLYPQGYFSQRIGFDGQQEAHYEKIDLNEVPARTARTPSGEEVFVRVELPGRVVTAKVWHIQVGRVPLYLLDTDVDPNAPEDRELAARLYGGDQEMRLSQEIILGIGGVRALRALGIEPLVWHMNEGHSAFIGLERVRELVQEAGLSFDEACEVVAASTLFTTHTPVAAGHDAFPFDLIERYFYNYWPQLGIGRDQFLDLARHDTAWGPRFSMTVLALRLSAFHNGVSELHGRVSRHMWTFLWPGVPEQEIPIGHITNGVHATTWLAPELAQLFDRYLPADWRERLDDATVWEAVETIPDEALWEVHCALKGRLVDELRGRVTLQRLRHGESLARVQAAEEVLDPNALTIGFARRFATYKRATLIFRDLERIRQLINDPDRPIQLIFAGKAHPADEPGKALIRTIHNISQQEGFLGRVLFVEDYDMYVARLLVQGVDLWLNTPRRPLEASGTSGMKAAMNGVPNFSVLDGWWREAYQGDNGWAIGEDREYPDEEAQDEADALSLYTTLEREIIPLFFDRDGDGVPHGWLRVAKASIRSVAPFFNTQRMMKEYVECYYLNAADWHVRLRANHYALAKQRAAWKQKVRQAWPAVRIERVDVEPKTLRVGQRVGIAAVVNLGSLSPEDVTVEALFVSAEEPDSFRIISLQMAAEAPDDQGRYRYEGAFEPHQSGKFALDVRVVPATDKLVVPHELCLVTWAQAQG